MSKDQELHLELIKAAVYEVGLLFNQSPSEDKINAYAKALQNYSPKQITFAFNQVILSGTAFFPSLAEVLKHLRPPQERIEERAPVIANEAIAAATKYSIYDKEKNVLEEVSIEVRKVIQLFGGVRAIGEWPSENSGTLRAQLERLAKGVLSQIDSDFKNKRLERLGVGSHLKIVDSEMKGLTFDDFQPEGA